MYVYAEMRANFRQGIKFRFVSAATSARWSRVKKLPVLFPDGFHCTAYSRYLFRSSAFFKQPSPVGRHLRFVAE